MNTINERIRNLAEVLFKGNISAFARAINVPQPTLKDIVGGRLSKPRYEVLEKIVNAVPLNISSEWLLTGKGEMLREEEKEYENPKLVTSTYEEIKQLPVFRGVPYYENVEATCGIVSQYNDYPENPAFFINYEHFNDCTAYIPVVGDSMYPQYCAGEIIAVKRIYNIEIIQWGEAYFVVTNENANDLKTVKLVFPHEDRDKIILRASNPNFKGDTVINKADIISMFIIKGKIKRNQL